MLPAPSAIARFPSDTTLTGEVLPFETRTNLARESIYYYDQQSGAVYDAQGNLMQTGERQGLDLHSEVMQQRDSQIEEHPKPPTQSSQSVQHSTSIKWHPSTRGNSGSLPRRCNSAGKDTEDLRSPTSSMHDAAFWSNHAGNTTPTSDSADLLHQLPGPASARVVELEVEEEDDSPYPEVRASVSNLDDPTMPSITFRSLLLGLGLSASASAVNTFLSLRDPPIQIVAIIIQILAHPLGIILANVLPIRSFHFRLPSLRRGRDGKRLTRAYTCSFNPGPWNIKEHTVVLIAATTGLNPSYSLSILLAQDLERFWDDRRSFLYGFLSVCAPQLIGLALAGFVRQVLVEPASMIWPQNLAVSTVLNTLHADEDSLTRRGTRRMSRLRFFYFASAIAFVAYFFPGYLFTALSIFNWVCWIWPTNVPVYVVFGVANGLGASVLTFDWTQINFLGSPLVTPWWAQLNLFGGFGLGICIAAPILYFTNALHTAYLPILSSGSFDRFGQPYSASSIVSPGQNFADAYAAYSHVYISAGLIIAYFGGFALITATMMHTMLYHGRFVWERLRTQRTLPDDVHARMMRRYASLPNLWYAVVLIIGLVMSVLLNSAYSTGLPMGMLCLAILIPVAYMLPFGFMFAMSGLPAGVNLVSELVASWLLPGKPLPVMMFKTTSQQCVTFGLLFAQDLKLSWYMKLAPRETLLVQLLSIAVNSVVQILAKNYVRDHIAGLCDPNQPQRFSCPTVNIFYTASIIWGAIGVKRGFGARSQYRALLVYGLSVGAVLPLLTWYTSRKLKWSKMRYVSAPIVFVGMSLAPPAAGINFTSAIVVGYLFQYWMRRHRLEWWSRYNFVLAGAVDFGTVVSVSGPLLEVNC